MSETSVESAARLERIPAAIRHVHLIGVGGTAMAALAAMLAERGMRVTGSDNQLYEPTASLLRNSRVEVMTGFGAHNLSPAPDLAVVGNVILRGNPEAQALLASGIAYVSMPEALWHFFLKDRRVLMVTGTHGKTTSTAMLAHILNTAARDPSMLVGGVARNFSTNYRLGAGDDFVIEGDEYDTAFFDKGPKFLHYRAHGVIITAVEFDHADIYRDLEHVKSSFRALADQMDSAGVLAVCADCPAALEVSDATRARRVTFGLGAGRIRAANLNVGPAGASFAVEDEGRTVTPPITLPIGGRMNVANALGAFSLLWQFGLAAEEIANGLESFAGVVRRQEIVGEAGGITVIDDFAKHPTAVRVTLEALSERFPGRRLLAAFEPRSNTTRRKVLQREFATAFDRARRVYLAPVFFKETDPIPPGERLDVKLLALEISGRGPAAFACGSTTEILDRMVHDARPGDVCVFMSNGPFDSLKMRFLSAIRSHG